MISVPHTQKIKKKRKRKFPLKPQHNFLQPIQNIASRGAEYEITTLLFHFFSTPKQTIHLLRQFSSVLIQTQRKRKRRKSSSHSVGCVM